MFFYKFIYWLIYQVFKTKIEIIGRKNLEKILEVIKSGGFIIVANHNSSLDPFIIAYALRSVQKELLKRKKKIFFVGMTQLSVLVGILGEKIGYLPANIKSIRRGIKLLSEGNGIVIFPEGKRNPFPVLEKPKRGAAFLALASGARIVPMGCFSPPTRNFLEVLKNLLFGKFKIKIGEPLSIVKLPLDELKKRPIYYNFQVEIISHYIMKKISKLCEKDYKICFHTL